MNSYNLNLDLYWGLVPRKFPIGDKDERKLPPIEKWGWG